MTNKQHQIEIEDETTVVRVLSVIFVMLMLLIVNSYSDISPTETTQNSETLVQSSKNKMPLTMQLRQVKNNQSINIETRVNKESSSRNNI